MTYSLDDGRDSAVRAVRGTLVRESQISLGGSPGRDLIVTARFEQIDYVLHARIYTVGNRVYIVQVVYPKSAGVAAESESRFFDSFQVRR